MVRYVEFFGVDGEEEGDFSSCPHLHRLEKKSSPPTVIINGL